MDGLADTKRKKLFFLLIILEIVMAVVLILAGQLQTGLMTTIIRVIMLLVANFCVQSSYALFYSLLAIFSGLTIIDPLGLFLSGHSRKTSLQNIMCIVGFFMSFVLMYIGYLYFKELKLQQAHQPSDGQNQNYSYFGNITQNRPTNQNQSYSYGGTNYLYQNPSGNTNNENIRRTTNNQSSWQPFTGQGYRLG